jgi:hypothetical protein
MEAFEMKIEFKINIEFGETDDPRVFANELRRLQDAVKALGTCTNRYPVIDPSYSSDAGF